MIRTLIGYLAAASQVELLCDGEACVIVGSKAKLKAHLASLAPERMRDYVIRKGLV